MAPGTRWAEEGLYLLALTAADNGEPAQSRAYLARLLKEYPKGLWTDVALWLRGWLAYKERDLGGALAAWERLVVEEPGSRLKAAALYWRGRALEAAKKVREAAEVYRTILRRTPDQNYYVFRARDRLGRLGKAPPPLTAPAEGLAKPALASNTLRARKARALRDLGLPDEAAEEYSGLVRGHLDDRTGLAEACGAFLEMERYDKAVGVGRHLLRLFFVQREGKPPIQGFWQCTYPLGYWPLVQGNAQQQGLDPLLVLALIREESAFAPQVVSAAGARGLMQLMSYTAEQVARTRGSGPVPTSPLEEPEVNIRLGTMHLAELLQDYGGNVRLALAAYNAGATQVRRWQEKYGFTDEEEFTEDIPYSETRNYVKRVLGSYERYTVLYGSKRAASREPRAEKEKTIAKDREPKAETGKSRAEQRKAGGS
jgi:soluble lytic murein transglycosylase